MDEYADVLKTLGCQENADQLTGCNGRSYTLQSGVWHAPQFLSSAQEQTSNVFSFKWQKEDTFNSAHSLKRMENWLRERYGDVESIVATCTGKRKPVLLDAGCGAAMSALELFDRCMDTVHYVGVDVSEAVTVARKRVMERGHTGIFLRENLMQLPFAPASVDILFSEGVLHHTDSTRGALLALTPLLRPGGYFLFYVYNKKGPIREFTDDHIRDKMQTMSPEEAWEAMKPLTKLGIELGRANVDITVSEDIALLDIPAGTYPLQRLIYWHVFKAFFDPHATMDELNHINYDWYAPRNAHRQTPEQVREWCEEAGLLIEKIQVEQAGITVVARKKAL